MAFVSTFSRTNGAPRLLYPNYFSVFLRLCTNPTPTTRLFLTSQIFTKQIAPYIWQKYPHIQSNTPANAIPDAIPDTILGSISSFIMYSPMFLFVPRSTSPDTRPEKLRSNFRTRCRDVNPDAVSFLLTHPLLYSPMNY